MAEVEFSVGNRDYKLACNPGEEDVLRKAATMLDVEAQAILEQVGRMPETRLLLLAGLMLADRTAAIEAHATTTQSELARARKAAEAGPETVLPDGLHDRLSELAARAEAIADKAEDALQP